MTNELREKIAALRDIAPELNSAADVVNAVVKAVERLLVDELKIGISAESDAFDDGYDDTGPDDDEDEDEEYDNQPYVSSHLAFGRINGSYKIHIIDITINRVFGDNGCMEKEFISSNRREWSSCPREVRLEAVTKLPELLGIIADKARQKADEAGKASQSVRDLMDAIGTGPTEETKFKRDAKD